MTRGEIIWGIFSAGLIVWVAIAIGHNPSPSLTVQHPTLETVAAATPGGLYKFVALEMGTCVPKDSVYYTTEFGHFRTTDRPGEILLVPSPRTIWHPDSCAVRLEVVK